MHALTGNDAATLILSVRQHRGMRPGTASADAARIRALERENAELRRVNAILRTASAFFAAELGHR
jgi:transposase-like protein